MGCGGQGPVQQADQDLPAVLGQLLLVRVEVSGRLVENGRQVGELAQLREADGAPLKRPGAPGRVQRAALPQPAFGGPPPVRLSMDSRSGEDAGLFGDG